MKYLVCNFKNNLTQKEVVNYANKLSEMDLDKTSLILMPSVPFLSFFSDNSYTLGSQDISSFSEETITGEVTGKQLASLGVSYVLVGHYERREFKNEINIDFINKINHAQENNLNVIYCIGETLEDKENGNAYIVLEKQISEVLNNVELKNIMIAYEPIWTVGTGVTADPHDIEDHIQFIKDIIDEKYECNIKVLYGGSISVDNIGVINKINNIDGFLVGTDCLDPDNVEKMLKNI